jgi:hypothetical protein
VTRKLKLATTSLRREFRAWRTALPTALERDTLLVPEWVAESVVQEVERFLDARLRDDFAERLAAKAHYLYPRHAHFKKMLNRPGNRGRDNLYMYMRHWTASRLKRERYALFKRLPWEYAHGQRLPNRQVLNVSASPAPSRLPRRAVAGSVRATTN